jgi:hypothetical protein
MIIKRIQGATYNIWKSASDNGISRTNSVAEDFSTTYTDSAFNGLLVWTDFAVRH